MTGTDVGAQSLSLWAMVAVGGAVGAVARYAVGLAALRLFGAGYPVATLCVNVAGSFALGGLVHWLNLREASPELRLLLTVGFLGAFTTFSTFALDAYGLYRDRSLAVASIYVAASVVLSIAGLVAGLVTARSLT